MLSTGFLKVATSEEFVQGIFALLKGNFTSDKIDYILSKVLTDTQLDDFKTIKQVAFQLKNLNEFSINDIKKTGEIESIPVGSEKH